MGKNYFGKGEVESSILSHSTINPLKSLISMYSGLAAFGKNRKIEAGTYANCTSKIRAGCSTPVHEPSRRGLIAAALAAPFVMRSTPAATAPAPSIRLLVAGQSLGSFWTHSPAFGAFVRRLRQTGETRPITMLDVAVGGTSALKRYRRRPDGYWRDEDTGRPGPMLRRAVDEIKREANPPNVLVWIEGETVSAQYEGTTGAEDMAFLRLYRDAVLAIIATLRSACSPNAPLTIPAFVQRLGPRNGEMEFFRGMGIVRRAQEHIVGSRERIYWGARPDATIQTRDGLHPTDEGFAGLGEETAEAVRGRI